MEQKWPSHLVIVRHGESERNIAKTSAKLGGVHSFGSGLRDMDTALTEIGRQQATQTGDYLSKHYTFDAVFASPYCRTLQTTEVIASHMTLPPAVIIEERVRELEFGILDGLTTEGIQHQHPEEYRRRDREGKYWYWPPGGESRPDVALRVHSFLGTLSRDYRGKSILVVCHSVVVLIFRRLLERWDEAQYLQADRDEDVLNCSITAYRYALERTKLLLDCYNKVCYKATSDR